MTTKEIQEAAIASSTRLLAWMEDQGKGREEIAVHKISRDGKARVLSLKVATRLFNTDAIFFKVTSVKEELDTNQVKVKHYDKEKGILIVKPTSTYLDAFLDPQPADVKVISDLRWLVERTQSWYVQNGASLAIPETSSAIAFDFDIVEDTLGDKKPNADQLAALKMIFAEPFSYVWGAPGTGKTQLVLAYAALRYIRADQKIAILAPTNLSLEQVLRGVLEMTKLAGVSNEKVLRLGNPTKAFAEDFPEVCEVRGLQKQLDAIDKQLEILTEIQTVRDAEHELQALRESIAEYPEEVGTLTAELAGQVRDYDAVREARRRKEIDVIYPEKELTELTGLNAALRRKQGSVWTKLGSLIGWGSGRIQEEIDHNGRRVEVLKKEQMFHQRDLEKLLVAEQEAEEKRDATNRRMNALATDIVTRAERYDWLTELLGDEALERVAEDGALLVEAIDKRVDELEVTAALAAAYAHYSPDELTAKRKAYEEERKFLERNSTAVRLESANIVAATLDSYIIRYQEEKLNVAHLFLDEAGYANQIKAMTLFNHDLPITFLGDHQQLPPVCEVQDEDIRNTEGFGDTFLWAESAIHIGLLFGVHSGIDCRTFYLNNQRPDNVNLKIARLTKTHRFGEALAAVLSEFVYDGQFSSAVGDGQTRIRVVDAKRHSGDLGRRSSGEVEAIAVLAESYRKEARDYVILSPYKNQIAKLKNKLPLDRNEERLLTVHKSQGREWDTVVLSVTDNFPSAFTDSTHSHTKGLNVINTAVSRAKKELVIVCNLDNWGNWPGQLLHGLVTVAS
jgi:hypothetical protein